MIVQDRDSRRNELDLKQRSLSSSFSVLYSVMKRSRLWNQEFVIRTPVVRDGKVVGTIGVPMERPRTNVEPQSEVGVDGSDDGETTGNVTASKGKGKDKERIR